MKTLTTILTILAAAGILSSQSTININFVGLEEIYNDHVGHDWYEEVKVSYAGREYRLRKGTDVDITVNANEPALILETYIQESDKYPDIATERRSINLSDIDNYQLIEIETLVREGHGRYAGNEAK